LLIIVLANFPITFAVFDDWSELFGSLVWLLGIGVLPICLLGWLAYFLLSLPLQRQERVRLVLDLLENALKQSRPVEQTFIEVSATRDASPGVWFHLFAARLEAGEKFSDALRRVPRLLPPSVTEMLRVGEQLGDLRKVLPACRAQLQDAQSPVRGAENYLVVIAFVLSPVTIVILNIISVFVLPKFNEIISEMVGETPAFFRLFEAVAPALGWGQMALYLLLAVGAFFYVGGPRAAKVFNWRWCPLADWLAWRVPWKRKRMQRNFSAMLAVLLDGGVPEADALRLAGGCTANEIFRRRAALAQAALARGVQLTEAVQSLDDVGEFRWRLTNAVHAHGGFLRALAGWHEALDAKAFQQEQAAAHIVTSALVVLNGCIIALADIGVFSALISIIEEGTLW
jgi:type II secretory pathway component PulF